MKKYCTFVLHLQFPKVVIVFLEHFFTKTDIFPMTATTLCPACSYSPATSILLVRHFHRTTS